MGWMQGFHQHRNTTLQNEIDEDDEDDFNVGHGLWPKPVMPYVRETPKVGRNDSCPCGSGKKFKKCCLE